MGMEGGDAIQFIRIRDIEEKRQPVPSWFLDLVHSCAVDLLGAHNLLVKETLCQLGLRSGADRVWLFQYNADATLFRNIHEWCREGFSEHGDELQDVPVSMIAWLQEHLADDCAVMVRCIKGLPRSAKSLRLEFERQGDKSVLTVPIFHQGKIWGCIGFDAVREEMSWGEQEVHLLLLCGRLMAAAAAKAGVAVEEQGLHRRSVIHLNGADGTVLVEIRKIIGVKAERDYTRVHYAGGGLALELRPLKIWRSLLPKDDFQQVHRGAIVNVRYIESTRLGNGGRMAVLLGDLNEEWSVSRPYRADLRSRLGY